MANPAVYDGDQLARERSELSAQVARHDKKWLEVSAEYEEGTAD